MNRFLESIAIGLLASVALAAPGAGAANISTSNVDELELLWDFPLDAGVTATAALGNGLLYISSWDGFVYALDPDTGSVVWSFDTGSGVIIGMPGGVMVDPNGNVCFGDTFSAHVWCRDGLTGSAIWDRTLGTFLVDAVWSNLATANGRLFVSVASLQDVPCTTGRLIALDLASGADLWTLVTIPEKICDTDTSIECSLDSECGVGGRCVDAEGAGVTATVSFDPTGEFVYMNTVGCFTFPSVGDSDSIFKIDAATGSVAWKTRVNPPEQFGFCLGDPNAAECGLCTDPNAPSCSATPCAVGTCTDKCPEGGSCPSVTGYHDYGFLNGPVRVETTTAGTLLVSGSKNGTLYALNEPNGTITWTNSVLPLSVSPDFAGFGLFNGPIAIANGRVHAALYEFNPVSVPEPEHLQAFDVETGATLWTDEIGPSWSGIGLANGVVYAGNNDTAEFFAYNAGTGVRLAAFSLPDTTVSRATVVGDTLYIGYGIFSTMGGVRAYRLPPSEAPTGIPMLPGSALLLLAALVAGVATARLLRRAQA